MHFQEHLSELIEACTDAQFQYGAHSAGRAMAAASATVRQYMFSYSGKYHAIDVSIGIDKYEPEYGVGHEDDLRYLFR